MARSPNIVRPPTRGRPPLVDPRRGDIEADESSPERRSLLAIAGNLIAEVSFPKLALATLMLVVIPAIIIGIAPLAVVIWFNNLARAPGGSGLGAALITGVLIALAWYGGRPLLRAVERSFWSLNAMAIQPSYAACREGLMHLASRLRRANEGEASRARTRAVSSALSGIAICIISLAIFAAIWPSTHWAGTLADLRTPHWLTLAALANALAVAAAYVAAAGLVWGVADATMPQPRVLGAFRNPGDFVRSWRVAHVSDIHVVGERYGFRLGSGRAGPRGNDCVAAVLARLDELHRRQPLDAIIVTGDLTDAGTSAEWAELLDAFAAAPRLASLIVALPGNHDLNVVDRANPARFDLPTSPMKRLRRVRTLSALAALQGSHMQSGYGEGSRTRDTLDGVLASHAQDLAAFADSGSRRLARPVDGVWRSVFPMVRPPARADGLGIIVLDSNAESHFSFTNALGLLPADQVHALEAVIGEYPRATWIVALHHHIVEHPELGNALAERVGTTLINGNWFTRRLQRVARRVVVMHGHRHIDWIGECGDLLIVSAPSSVMRAPGHTGVYFYVHTVGVDANGRAGLAEPERVDAGLAYG